jgi:predicted small metal-binding protein
MAKVIRCQKVNLSSDFHHVIRGATEDEVLQKAAVHAAEHGMELNPQLLAEVKSCIEEELSQPQVGNGSSHRELPRIEFLTWGIDLSARAWD